MTLSDHLANKDSQPVKGRGVRPVSFGEFPIKFTALLALQWSHSPQNWSNIPSSVWHSLDVGHRTQHAMTHSLTSKVRMFMTQFHHRWPWNTDTLQVYDVHWAFVRVQRSKNSLQEGRDNTLIPHNINPVDAEEPQRRHRCGADMTQNI